VSSPPAGPLREPCLEPGGHLFLCADPNQGFLRSRLSWKSVGLDVVGRTKKLRRSYRTTRALLEAAGGVLAGLSPAESDDYLSPELAGMEPGVRPVVIYASTPHDAIDRVANEIVALLRRRVPRRALLVLYGDAVDKLALHRSLLRCAGPEHVWWFNRAQERRAPPHGYGRDYLRMANVDTATGLEAAAVFLLGVESLLAPEPDAGDTHAGLREEKRRKLYMAMTRAGERLVLVSTRPLPPGLAALFEAQP